MIKEVSDLKVMSSAAGYYLGRSCITSDEWGEYSEPFSRESGYFNTEEEAAAALVSGFTTRENSENSWAYSNGLLPTAPGTFVPGSEQ